MGCAISILTRAKIKPEQEQYLEKQEEKEVLGQINNHPDQIHEQEPPSQPLSAWEARGRKNSFQPEVPLNPHHASELGKETSSERIHDQVLPNQPHTWQTSQEQKKNQSEQINKEALLTGEPHPWKSRGQEEQNPLEQKHVGGPPTQQKRQKQPGHVHEQPPKSPPYTWQPSEEEQHKKREQIHEQGILTQSQEWKSRDQVHQNQTQQVPEQSSPIPSNTREASEIENQLEQVHEQKPLTQALTLHSGDLEKETQPEIHEREALTQLHTTQRREVESQSEPANHTRPASHQGLPEQELIPSQSEKQWPVKETESSSEPEIHIPEHWAPEPWPNKNVHTVPVPQEAPEYQKVINQVQTSSGKLSIQKIERVQNLELYQSYMQRKQKMDKDNSGTDNERYLFHGADHRSMIAIKTGGFNRDSCGAQKKAYGRGLYFTKDAFFSVGYAGGSGGDDVRYLYLTRVLVGQYCQGKPSFILPPPKEPSIPETLYESVVDNTEDPSIFVVFYGNQCYPEYLLTL